MKILAFDIGGTKIAYGLVDEYGQMIGEPTKIATPYSTDEIKKIFQKVISENEADGIAFATAGVVFNNKLVHQPFNLPQGYENIDFTSFSQKPVIVENDANAAAWCEYKLGEARSCNHAIVLVLGTGVGCGIICNGQLLKGKSGAAGECAAELGGNDLSNLAQQNNVTPNCFKIRELSLKGDLQAQKVYNIWQNRVLETMVQLNDLFDTQKIIVAGTLGRIIDYEYLQNSINATPFGEPPLITRSAGFKFPALSGVALMWCDAYKKQMEA